MLQTFREKFTGWVAIAILGLIGVTFVFVGGANFAFVGNNYAAKVDGVEIGAGSFENAYRRQLEQNPQLAQLPAEFRQQVRENVLESLVQQQLIDNYLEDAGFRLVPFSPLRRPTYSFAPMKASANGRSCGSIS